jgi:hypothetical protein
VTTLNKIKQYNKMVYGKNEGGSKTKNVLHGVPNKSLMEKLGGRTNNHTLLNARSSISAIREEGN